MVWDLGERVPIMYNMFSVYGSKSIKTCTYMGIHDLGLGEWISLVQYDKITL